MTPPPPVSFPNLPRPSSASTISHLTTSTGPANKVLATQPISLLKTSQSVFKQKPDLDAVAAASNKIIGSPAKKPSRWSKAEDDEVHLLKNSGMKWEKISEKLRGRSALSCRLHYRKKREQHPFPEASNATFNHQSASPSTKPGHHPHGCFRCKIPGAFGTCHSWKRHMKEHETVFPCRQCEDSDTARNPRSYTRKATLVKHLFDTHNMSNLDASAQADTWRKTVKEHKTVFPCRQCEDSDTARNPRNYTRKVNLVKHLFDTHNMSGSDASAQADTWRKEVKRKYFSCGFCVSLFYNVADQLSHIDTEHFQCRQDISGWNISNVIKGLIQQPGVSHVWQNSLGMGYPRSLDFTWNDSVAKDLQLRLELSEESAEVLAAAAISQVIWTEIPQQSDEASVTGGFTNPHMEMDQNILSVQTPIRSPSADGCPHGRPGALGNLAFTPVNIPPINSPLYTQKNFARDDEGREEEHEHLPGFTEFIMGVVDLARSEK